MKCCKTTNYKMFRLFELRKLHGTLKYKDYFLPNRGTKLTTIPLFWKQKKYPGKISHFSETFRHFFPSKLSTKKYPELGAPIKLIF